jgi:hypothetical protein
MPPVRFCAGGDQRWSSLPRHEILKYIADKATVTGHLDGSILQVEMIGKPGKAAWNNLSPAVKGLAAA